MGAKQSGRSSPRLKEEVPEQNEKAARQQGDLLFSRENSSNGRQSPSKLSGENLMSRKRGVSSNLLEINAFIFNDLQKQSILGRFAPK
jgi:hypothetical protein